VANIGIRSSVVGFQTHMRFQILNLTLIIKQNYVKLVFFQLDLTKEYLNQLERGSLVHKHPTFT